MQYVYVFSVCTLQLWNKPPGAIKMAKTVDSFKPHLFKVAYVV